MELAQKSDEVILKAADRIMDDVIEGLNKADYEKHTRHFTPTMKRSLGKKQFAEVCRRYQEEWGQFTTREVVSVFRRTSSVAVVWRQSSSKQPGELVVGLVLVESDARYLVAHSTVY
jgi:hypothetical protein